MSHTSTLTETHFRRILSQYQQMLYWHIRHIVGHHEDAEDALQETFLRVYRHIDRLREEKSERAWLYRIATNEALRVVENRRTTDDVTDYDLIQEESPNYENIQRALEAAIEKLPPRQRAVFSMRYYDEMSYEDIAITIDSNIKAVTANFHYAQERIRKYLLSL